MYLKEHDCIHRTCIFHGMYNISAIRVPQFNYPYPPWHLCESLPEMSDSIFNYLNLNRQFSFSSIQSAERGRKGEGVEIVTISHYWDVVMGLNWRLNLLLVCIMMKIRLFEYLLRYNFVSLEKCCSFFSNIFFFVNIARIVPVSNKSLYWKYEWIPFSVLSSVK